MPALLNKFGQALLERLEDTDMTVPELAAQMREQCSGCTCRCQKLTPWDIATAMTSHYHDDGPSVLLVERFFLLASVLGLSHEQGMEFLRLLGKGE